MNIRKIKGYGWKRSLPDPRDIVYSPKRMVLQALPPSVDLRPTCPPVYDQGDLGSCTANAVGGLVQFLEIKEKNPSFVPSRLFIYYNERVLENTVSQDAGAELRSGMKVLANLGAPHESLWWYDINKFTVKPNRKVYADGLKHKVLRYSRIDNTRLDDMRACLADGYPIAGGFAVYQSFETSTVTRTGIVPMPSRNERMLGGHAILVVGYNDAIQRFIVRNSWGASWGIQGYFTIPYLYFTNGQLADDFWTATFVQ
jgi:C1A family cysteine protease